MNGSTAAMNAILGTHLLLNLKIENANAAMASKPETNGELDFTVTTQPTEDSSRGTDILVSEQV